MPFDEYWPEGIFCVQTKSGLKFSKTYLLKEIGYGDESEEEQFALLEQYWDTLNSLPQSELAQIHIISQKRQLDMWEVKDLNESVRIYADELTKVWEQRIQKADQWYKKKCLTLATIASDYDSAVKYFVRVERQLKKSLNAINSDIDPLNLPQRVELLRNWYSPCDYALRFERLNPTFQNAHDFVAPQLLWFGLKDYQINDRFGRAYTINLAGQLIRDDMIEELHTLPCQCAITVNITPKPHNDTLRIIRDRTGAVQSQIEQWRKKQQQKKMPQVTLPWSLQQKQKYIDQWNDDINNRNQHLFDVEINLVLEANSLEQLAEFDKELKARAQKFDAKVNTLFLQQDDGLISTLPWGLHLTQTSELIKTEELSALQPFNDIDIMHDDGISFGVNPNTSNPIRIDLAKLKNGNMLIFASPGSGKSFTAKLKEMEIYLRDLGDILILDPEGEYKAVVQALGGSSIVLSSDSNATLNALELDQSEDETTSAAIARKYDYVQALLGEMLSDPLSDDELSIIERTLRNVYQPYFEKKAPCPTLIDFVTLLGKQSESVIAQKLLLKLERYTNGSLNMFSRATNVDLSNRLLHFDIKNLGKNMWGQGILTVLDVMENHIIQNHKKGRYTFILIDEMWTLFGKTTTENWIDILWRRLRKYLAFPIGITQNIRPIMESTVGRSIVDNTGCLILLQQGYGDAVLLQEAFNLSESQVKYIRQPDQGEGLLIVENQILPFSDRISSDLEIYRLCSTKASEQKREP